MRKTPTWTIWADLLTFVVPFPVPTWESPRTFACADVPTDEAPLRFGMLVAGHSRLLQSHYHHMLAQFAVFVGYFQRDVM